MNYQPLFELLCPKLVEQVGTKFVLFGNQEAASFLESAGAQIVHEAENGAICFSWKSLTREDYVSASLIAERYTYIFFEGASKEATDWLCEFFAARGFVPEQEISKFIKERKWGCKCYVKVGQPQRDLVSVIIPCFNCEAYLKDSLGSILAQSHQTLQIIFVDDGSSDNSVSLARSLLEGDILRPHKVLQIRKSGASQARNIGIKHAIGDYIVCFDADDYMPSDYLKGAVTELKISREKFVYPRAWWSVPEELWSQELITKLQEFEIPNFSNCDIPFRGVIVSYEGCSLLANSGSYEQASRIGSSMIISTVCSADCNMKFDPSLPCLQDWDMHRTLFTSNKGSGYVLPAPIIRRREKSITSFRKGKNEELTVREKHSLSPAPKILFVTLNSKGEFDNYMASTVLRGHKLSAFIENSVTGDLTTLSNTWSECDVVYFVCPPLPQVCGWIEFLSKLGVRVLFDVCVMHWSHDFLYQGWTAADRAICLKQIAKFCTLVFCSSQLCQAFAEDVISDFESLILPDAVHTPEVVKSSFEKSKKVCWIGDVGNLPSLLVFTEELVHFTEHSGYTIRLICDYPPFRLPFRWEWIPFKWSNYQQYIIETDAFLLPSLNLGSYRAKGTNKQQLGLLLGMPIVTMTTESSRWVDQLERFCTMHQKLLRAKSMESIFAGLQMGTSQVRARELVNYLLSRS